MKYQCVLTKISNNHHRLRTDVINGGCNELPCLGACFEMFAESLHLAEGVRCVNTSPIISIQRDDWIFHVVTQSESRYQITIKGNY